MEQKTSRRAITTDEFGANGIAGRAARQTRRQFAFPAIYNVKSGDLNCRPAQLMKFALTVAEHPFLLRSAQLADKYLPDPLATLITVLISKFLALSQLFAIATSLPTAEQFPKNLQPAS